MTGGTSGRILRSSVTSLDSLRTTGFTSEVTSSLVGQLAFPSELEYMVNKFLPDSVFIAEAETLMCERIEQEIPLEQYQLEFETLLAMYGWTRNEWLSELNRRITARRSWNSC